MDERVVFGRWLLTCVVVYGSQHLPDAKLWALLMLSIVGAVLQPYEQVLAWVLSMCWNAVHLCMDWKEILCYFFSLGRHYFLLLVPYSRLMFAVRCMAVDD